MVLVTMIALLTPFMPGQIIHTQLSCNQIPAKNDMHKYAVIISWSPHPGDQVFVADVPELPGCTAHGDTHEEALANAQQAISLWLDTCKEFDHPIPSHDVISSIMRSEYVDLTQEDIGKTSPAILRAQIDSLCKEYCCDANTDSLGNCKRAPSQG